MAEPRTVERKLLVEHRPGCWCKDDPEGIVFIVARGQTMLDSLGRRNGSGGGQTWFKYRCNDPNCPAILAVRWKTIARAINGVDDEQ
jgi:hypothetical protein